MSVGIEAFGHVGIRVRDRARSVAFYGALGFEEVFYEDAAKVAILRHPSGLEINLIVNAASPPEAGNVLMDLPVKHPGYTHASFWVASLDEAIAALEAAKIRITEGPVELGGSVRAVFVRDPDGNVVELDEPLTPR
jgi:catechol 2,3-dioxygenase-like lactoylglutathione lyase family enzyme